MPKFLTCLSTILLVVLPPLTEVASAADQTKDDDRLRNCGMVLKEILDVPDNIPQNLLDKADCVVVFPSVLKAAFIHHEQDKIRSLSTDLKTEAAALKSHHRGSAPWAFEIVALAARHSAPPVASANDERGL